VLEPLLPAPGNTRGRNGRREKHPRRLVLDAIFCLIGGGVAGARLPREFLPCRTVYSAFRRWVCDGSWRDILDASRDLIRVYEGRDPAPSTAVTDSQSVRGAGTVPGRDGRPYPPHTGSLLHAQADLAVTEI
jgi:transposase